MIQGENKKAFEKVSDLSYLSDTMGGNKKLIKEIIDVFLKQSPQELSALNDAVEKKDYTTIRSVSHTMKSSTSIMGISPLISILKEMEDLSTSNTNIEKIILLNNELNSICTQAIEEVQKESLNYI